MPKCIWKLFCLRKSVRGTKLTLLTFYSSQSKNKTIAEKLLNSTLNTFPPLFLKADYMSSKNYCKVGEVENFRKTMLLCSVSQKIEKARQSLENHSYAPLQICFERTFLFNMDLLCVFSFFISVKIITIPFRKE